MPPNDMFAGSRVTGLADVQQEIDRLATATDTSSADGVRRWIRLALGRLERFALSIVHVDQSRLKNSIFSEGPEGSGNDVFGNVAVAGVDYAPFEEARGGSHAFFGRTVEEEAPHINDLFYTRIAGRR